MAQKRLRTLHRVESLCFLAQILLSYHRINCTLRASLLSSAKWSNNSGSLGEVSENLSQGKGLSLFPLVILKSVRLI